jgi:hypothetical protein
VLPLLVTLAKSAPRPTHTNKKQCSSLGAVGLSQFVCRPVCQFNSSPQSEPHRVFASVGISGKIVGIEVDDKFFRFETKSVVEQLMNPNQCMQTMKLKEHTNHRWVIGGDVEHEIFVWVRLD